MYTIQAIAAMLRMPEKVVKYFEYYYSLPMELQMMVVDNMEPESRCNFAGCSKLCNAEAKMSENYIRSLELRIESEHKVCITVDFGDMGYCLEFRNQMGRNYMKYVIYEAEELWRMDLHNSKSLVQFAVEKFKELLESYQKSIRSLVIDTNGVDYEVDIDANIRKFTKIEELTVMGNCEVAKMLSKIRHPLKVLQMGTKEVERIPEHLIYETSQALNIENLTLNYAQFLQLAAPNVAIQIGDLTETDVFNFINSWANGENGRELRWRLWDLEGSKFDKVKLFGLFKHFDFEEDDFDIEVTIKHKKNAGKQAVLGCLGNTLQVTFEDVDSN